MALLNAHLSVYSYVGGYRPTQADRAVVASGCVSPCVPATLPNLRRWAAHMSSFTSSERQAFPPHTDGCKVCPVLCSSDAPLPFLYPSCSSLARLLWSLVGVYRHLCLGEIISLFHLMLLLLLCSWVLSYPEESCLHL